SSIAYSRFVLFMFLTSSFVLLDPRRGGKRGDLVRFVILCMAAFLLSGCISPQQMERILASQRPPSPEIRQAIAKAARDFLLDPFSVRDAEISGVMDLPGGKLQVVCVKENARNAFGAYAGRNTFSVRLEGARPVSLN